MLPPSGSRPLLKASWASSLHPRVGGGRFAATGRRKRRRRRYPPEAYETLASLADVVRDAQQGLRNLGYQVDVTGFIGPRTTAALVDFQSKHFLYPTGVLTVETVRTLEDLVPWWTMHVPSRH